MGGANPSTLDPYPDIPPKGWLPTIMNIAPGSISRPTKEKIPSKFLEGGWVLHQGMQTEKIIKRVIHRNVQTVSTKKKIFRHIHVKTDMASSVRGFRLVCNRKCLVEHTEHFNATHSCKKEIVKKLFTQAWTWSIKCKKICLQVIYEIKWFLTFQNVSAT